MTKFYVKPTPDDRWSVCETGQSVPLDSFDEQWRANFWSDRLNKAYADGCKGGGAIEQQKQAGIAVSIEMLSGLWDHLQWAWGIIANAGGGDWEKEAKDWQESARRWRDQYHRMLSKNPKDEPRTIAVSDDLMQRVKESLRNAFDLLKDPVCASMPWRAKVAAWRHDARQLQMALYDGTPEPKRPLFSMPKVTRDLPKESLPEFGKEVKQQQPMTATEFPAFPMAELCECLDILCATLMSKVGAGEMRGDLAKAYVVFRQAARAKGLL